MTQPDFVVIWLPLEEEHALAVKHQLCEPDREAYEEMIAASAEQVARDHPGTRVRVYQWRVHTVLQAMEELCLPNTPEGRARVFVQLHHMFVAQLHQNGEV